MDCFCFYGAFRLYDFAACCRKFQRIPSLIGTPTSNVTPSAATPDKANERLSDLLPIQIGTAPIMQVALPNDLWERIRKGFAMPDLQTDLAQDRVTWYSSRPDYLQRMSERS
ncbi:MAG: hypothetical protein EBQ84_14740, partial [Betaproteobacteria bacterium]|nr:hypothetical protein [Betaproteobacteria bacterium]